MAVFRHTLSILALLSLLVQAAFGVVSPVAVLCISLHHCDHDRGDRPIASETVTACDLNRCCAQTAPADIDVQHAAQDESHTADDGEEDRVRIALSAPCDDWCMDCVDVSLPSEVPAPSDWPVALDVPQLLMAYAVADELPPFALPVSDVLPAGTGPPETRCRAERETIRTTRMLI